MVNLPFCLIFVEVKNATPGIISVHVGMMGVVGGLATRVCLTEKKNKKKSF